MDVSVDGLLKDEVNHRIDREKGTLRTEVSMKILFINRRQRKRECNKSLVVPTLLYGWETWSLNDTMKRRRLEAVEIYIWD